MKLLLVLFFAAVACALEMDMNFILRHGPPPAGPPNPKSITPNWGNITQKQDNFDRSNPKTWQMRYIENGQFFQPGSPIFVKIGAEWTIAEDDLQSSQMFDMAEKHNAFMYYTEHRYYGKSHPTSDSSLENLKYLTPEQALADLAHFISKVKKNPGMENSKVIVFGCSYAGAMATWMRQKYPHLVHGAVASSAPLLYKVDFKEYLEVVQKVLGPKCSSIFMNAAKEILRLIYTEKNPAKVERDYNLCQPMQSDWDVQALFMYLVGSINKKVQNAEGNQIANECKILSNPDLSSDYDRMAAYTYNSNCKINYNDMNEYYKDTSLANRHDRQWLFQTCSNFGNFQTAWEENSLLYYGISLEYFTNQCSEVFGPTFTPEFIANNIAATNEQYGALNPGVTRVISIHGTADPWHTLGATTGINAKSPSYLVEGTSHCKDIDSLNHWGNEQMYYAKQAVVNIVAKWLQEPY